MATLHLLSDVHVEFHADGGRSFVEALDPTGVDVCVLAGDIGVGEGLITALEHFADRYPQVVFVCGNHEYYGCARPRLTALLEDLMARRPTIHWLENRAVEVAGVRFVGCTLWFADRPDNDVYSRFLSDFRVIPDFRDWVYDAHAASAAFLENEVRAGDVVVTHHIPDRRGVHPRWTQPPYDVLNRFFLSQRPLGLLGRPAHWVFGHTHDACAFTEGACSFRCNPFGYLGRETTGADYAPAVIEVG